MSTNEPATPGGFTIQKRSKWPWIGGVVAVIVIIAVVLGVTLTGNDDKGFDSHLKIAYATSTPAQKAIIEYVNKEIAPDYGISLEAVGYGDGDTVYRSVDEHKTAAHFTAHRYWTAEVNKRLGTHNFATDAEVYTWVGPVYSGKYRSLDQIPNGAKVSIPQEPSVQAQQLAVIAGFGFIELDKSVDPLFVSTRDITSNPRNWQFTPIELNSQPRVYQDFDITFGGDGVDPAALITTVPLPRAYSPPLTVAEDRRTDPNIVKLYRAFKDPRIQEWLKTGDGQQYKTVISNVPTDQPLVHPELYLPLDPNAKSTAGNPQPSAVAGQG
ncbi:MetQ/NlpA family ABC transporter substrate-binding protein [Gordonia soli]|uniref:Methionine ABC transporter substrate-binding protein n=1 Tax=Gordonia soli NBRC 108243 TaxID=1223545 RepID=M0QKR2_9ACTN|nr:MetQ/NlpA family ABC transporter substrate-binding protein [Gordonia soli]GAC69230.1 methionine ABC transporter substrate-binding protein [Gordonia soli NBRC 108243]